MAVNSPDPSDFIPERILDAPSRPAWMSRLKDVVADGLASALLNGLVAAAVLRMGWPAPPHATDPPAISVELVDHVPGAAAEQGEGKANPKSTGAPAEPQGATSSGQAAKEQQAQGQEAAKAEGPQAAAAGQTEAAKPPPRSDMDPPAVPPPQPDVKAAAVPPPVDRAVSDAKPHLVEAPPDPHRAVTQAATHAPANSTTTPDGTDDRAKPNLAPVQQAVLTAPAADEALPAAKPEAKAPPKPAEPSAEDKREAETTAKLAAALPFSQSFVPDTFRSALSGAGDASSAEYRGAVYGAFKKADAIVDEARERHLRGQAVIAFTIDENGALTEVHVAVSSGNPDVDQAALAIIEHSAPYPPPPPGAQRSFAPAIALGADQP